jgi:c-di-GMP-binding flagellar brake protein YcgR
MDIERRIYNRIAESIQVKFVPADTKWSSIPYDTTYTRNISGGGFLFTSITALNIGDIIELKFYVNNSNEFVPATAKVVRVCDIVDNKLYEIGIQFLKIREEDLQLLLQFVSGKN